VNKLTALPNPASATPNAPLARLDDECRVSAPEALFRSVFRGALLALLTACSSAPDGTFSPEVRLAAPRDYGYVMGDVIEHALSLDVADTYPLDTAALPQPGALNEWLAIRDLRWEAHHAGSRNRYRIQIAYQIFKGVRAPETVVIPPLPLRLIGPSPREIQSPAWPFTLVPVIPPELPNEQIEVRAPLPPETLSTAQAWRGLMTWSGVAALALALLGLRMFLKSRRSRPFAQACRRMDKTRHNANPETLLHSARLLHRAFDQTFGETLFAGDIERFCLAHPTFAPLQDQLVKFFALSQTLFFETGVPLGDIDPPGHWLADLGRRCAIAERKAL
jgi:mxaA protein